MTKLIYTLCFALVFLGSYSFAGNVPSCEGNAVRIEATQVGFRLAPIAACDRITLSTAADCRGYAQSRSSEDAPKCYSYYSKEHVIQAAKDQQVNLNNGYLLPSCWMCF